MNAPVAPPRLAVQQLLARGRALGRDVSSFEQLGLPTPRDEAWHYTNLRPLLDIPFGDAGPATSVPALPDVGGPALLFLNGRRHAGDAETSPPLPAGSAALTDSLAAMAAMLAEDGARIDIASATDGGTILLASHVDPEGDTPVSVHLRHDIRLAAGARLVLIERSTGRGSYLHNAAFRVELGEGAQLLHLRLQQDAAAAFHLSTLHADIAAGASYDSFTLVTGARLGRMQVHARLAGSGAQAHLNAAQLLRDSQHGDFTTVIRHEAPGCISRQTVKNVLDGHAHGVFQGRIEVARPAQKTDGYQMNQALLLSADAAIDSKPQLEIFADDVKCSHGATVGALDAEQLFYLRSRGIPEPLARSILVRAFLAEAFDPVIDPVGRALLDAAADQWWNA